MGPADCGSSGMDTNSFRVCVRTARSEPIRPVPEPADFRWHADSRPVDLIEKHDVTGVLRITDHKTGKPPERPPINIGGASPATAAVQPGGGAIAGIGCRDGAPVYCTHAELYRSHIAIKDQGRTRSNLRWIRLRITFDGSFLRRRTRMLAAIATITWCAARTRHFGSRGNRVRNWSR
jgi:hypothetical protein